MNKKFTIEPFYNINPQEQFFSFCEFLQKQIELQKSYYQGQ